MSRQPTWSSPGGDESIAIVARESEEDCLPVEAKDLGATHFIEVSVAMEFLDGWREAEGQGRSAPEQCERLIRYAIHDA